MFNLKPIYAALLTLFVFTVLPGVAHGETAGLAWKGPQVHCQYNFWL